MSSDPAIQIQNLTHSYGERKALDDVSFDVPGGSLFGLLGPNGGGKTTLFRVLCTLLEPTAGTARLYGFDVKKNPAEVRHHIGVVFQAHTSDDKLTVRENLMHQGRLYGYSGKELARRITATLDRLGLNDHADDRVEALSGGLRRRLELGQGLLHDPKVLLLDEPTTGLDAGTRREFKDYLRTLTSQNGMTVLLTTHLMDEAEMCDRLAILDHGKLITEDTPDALKETIGGDVLVMESSDPQALRDAIDKKFGGDPVVVEDKVRLERSEAHKFVATLIETFPGQVSSITVAKPTIEDAFVHLTGHGFWESSAKVDTI